MSDQGESKGAPARVAAAVEHTGWPGWIWAVPIAALGIVAWLGIRAWVQRGYDITVRFDDAGGMKAGDTSVRYRGIEVGKVTQLVLSQDGRYVDARLKMHDEVKKFLRTGTQFWLEGATPSLNDLSSLKAVVAGPTIIMEPGGGPLSRHYTGLMHRTVISGTPAELVGYVMSFAGDVGKLKVDSPVTLRGFTVGQVKQIGLYYDAATGAIETPVVIELEASRFHIEGLQPIHQQWKPVLDQVLQRLISDGLRGRLVQDPPMIGSYAISLDFVSGAPTAVLDTSGPLPVIPTTSGGGFDSILHRVNAVPIDKIAERVLEITTHVESIVSSPKLQQSIDHLDHTLAELDSTVHHTGPQITDLVQSLRQTGNEINSAVQAANGVLGNTPTNQDENLRTALYELTETARTVRSLADYLDRHPEALVKGRTGP
jgi:paraquat-inducible protein B